MQRKGVTGKIPDGYFTRSEVSAMTGVSISTLTRWRKSGHFMPERVEDYGKIRVGLYSQSQVDTLLEEVPYKHVPQKG